MTRKPPASPIFDVKIVEALNLALRVSRGTGTSFQFEFSELDDLCDVTFIGGGPNEFWERKKISVVRAPVAVTRLAEEVAEAFGFSLEKEK